MSDPTPAREPEATYSPEEVAQILGTSPWWVREQARSGRAGHLRVGKGRIRFTATQVAAIVERITVREGNAGTDGQPGQIDASVLGATVRSLATHRSRHNPAQPSREAT